MDYFWKELSKVTGPIPANIKIILEELRYIHGGLASIDENMIKEIEEEVRRLPEITGKPEKEWQKSLGVNGSLSNFRFMLGERSVLKLIATTVEKYGVMKFTKKLLNKESGKAGPSAGHVPDTQSARLKLIEFYKKKCSIAGTTSTPLLDQIETMKIDALYDEAGVKSMLNCPFCEAIVTIRQEKSGSWKLSNFVSHLRTKHDIPSDAITNKPTKRPHPQETSPVSMEASETETFATEYLQSSQESSQGSPFIAVNDQDVVQNSEQDESSDYVLHLDIKRVKYEDDETDAEDDNQESLGTVSVDPDPLNLEGAAMRPIAASRVNRPALL